MIVDCVTEPFKNPMPREVDFPTFIGMRRSGKTWCMYQEMHRLLAAGLHKEQLLRLNFEDDRLSNFKTSDWADLLPAYIEAYPDNGSKQLVLFLDEIQVAPEWEKFVLRWIERENALVYLSGTIHCVTLLDWLL
jgi:predicted AAA+ superfamily ATPase